MITIVSGTNRKNSVSKQIALHCQKVLESKNIETDFIDLMDLPDDFIESALYDNQGKNDQFNSLQNQVNETQKFLFIIPEYNGSFPGVVKAFLDGLKFPNSLKGKKCGIIGVSSGVQGGVMAISHLTDIFNYLGMHVLANKPKLMKIESLMSDGELIDSSSLQRVEEHAEALISF